MGGHVAHIGEIRISYNILVGKPERKRLLGSLGVKRKIILELILGKYGGTVGTGLVWLRTGTKLLGKGG